MRGSMLKLMTDLFAVFSEGGTTCAWNRIAVETGRAGSRAWAKSSEVSLIFLLRRRMGRGVHRIVAPAIAQLHARTVALKLDVTQPAVPGPCSAAGKRSCSSWSRRQCCSGCQKSRSLRFIKALPPVRSAISFREVWD